MASKPEKCPELRRPSASKIISKFSILEKSQNGAYLVIDKARRSVLKLTQIIIATLGFATLMGCSQKSPDSCGFVQNSSGERISWKNEVPIHLTMHSSIPVEYRGAVITAAEKWNRALGKNMILIENSVSDGINSAAKDGQSVIYMSNTWEADKASEQGRTSIYWIGDRITETDIKLNGQNFQFYWQSASQTQGVNIEALVMHEMGHVLGLKHKDTESSVMQTYLANNSDRTRVGETDIEALKCEY